MSSKQRILYEIESYDIAKLTEFLEANGLEEFTQVIQIKNVDGPQFLKIKEYEVLSWKPHVTRQQVRRLWAFITHFKENPDKYVIPKWKLPRPNITRQQLEHLCNDQRIINKLHNLLQERDLQQATAHQDSSDNQESFSSEDETYANHDVVVNRIPNRSSLHKLSFKDPTKDLKPITKINQKFDTSDTDSDELYENASNLPHIKPKETHAPTQIKVEEEVFEMYENRPKTQANKEIGIPVLPRPPLPKLSKSDEPESFKCPLGAQVLPRPPLPKLPEPNLNKEIASAPPKLNKPLPQIPQNDPSQPPVSSRGTKPDQTASVVSPTKNISQFLDARLHLETVLSGRVSPKKEEQLEEYLEPNPIEEEEMYEPEPSFQEKQSRNKFIRSGAIQTLPLPPLPAKIDLKLPEVNLRNRSEIPSKSSDKREIQARALPKPPTTDFEQAPQVSTLPRPPRKLPNFNNHLNAQSENDSESLLCYRYTDRDGSEMLLNEKLGDGAYLFRPSKKYYCTLSVRCESKIYHVGIKQNSDGQLECLSSGRHVLFNNLKEICQHFKANPLRMIDNYNNYKSILLKDVLPRDRT